MLKVYHILVKISNKIRCFCEFLCIFLFFPNIFDIISYKNGKETNFMKKILFKGAGSAVPTPFNENGVNLEEFKRFLQFQIDNDIDALIVCGTTGESSTMTKDEKIAVIKCAVKIANKNKTSTRKIPVIAGTGSNNTKEAIEMSKIAESLGVDGVLVVTPYYNKTTQKGLIAHYKAIAENINIPIILYNVPSRTGLNIEPETCLELSKIDNIVAIKEASR